MERLLKIPQSSKKMIGFLLIAGFIFAMGMHYIPKRPAFSDEVLYHLPLARQFYQTSPLTVIMGNEYSAANTPLPYIITVGVIKILRLSFDIYTLRTINLLVYMIMVALLFYGLLKRDAWMLIIMVCNVYLLKSAVLYYMTDWGVLFFAIFLILLKLGKNLQKPKAMVLLVFANLFAIMTQQFYLILPVALILGALIRNEFRIDSNLQHYIFISLAALLLPSLLFIKWGGITHQNFNSFNPVSFSPTNITAVLAIAGFNLAPFVLYKAVKVKKVYWALAVVALVFGIFLSPTYEHYWYRGAIVGITFRFIDTLAMQNAIATKLITSFFVYLGLYTFRELLRLRVHDIEVPIQQITVVLFTILYMFTSHLSERHLAPMIVLLYLMFLPRLQNRKIIYIWAAVQFIFGVVYVNHLFII